MIGDSRSTDSQTTQFSINQVLDHHDSRLRSFPVNKINNYNWLFAIYVIQDYRDGRLKRITIN